MGFITATRQCVAQANSWSLEELSLDVTVADESDQPSFDDCSFAVEGLKLSGAVCRGNQLAVSNEISTTLHCEPSLGGWTEEDRLPREGSRHHRQHCSQLIA